MNNEQDCIMELCDKELTEKIIACAYRVHNAIGAGFLEKIYENAMANEVESQALKFRRQAPLTVRYRDQVVGEYFADLLVEDLIICEFKAVETLSRIHEVQLVNYLVATGINTGLLINFGKGYRILLSLLTYLHVGKSVKVSRKFRLYKQPVNPEESC